MKSFVENLQSLKSSPMILLNSYFWQTQNSVNLMQIVAIIIPTVGHSTSKVGGWPISERVDHIWSNWKWTNYADPT